MKKCEILTRIFHCMKGIYIQNVCNIERVVETLDLTAVSIMINILRYDKCLLEEMGRLLSCDLACKMLSNFPKTFVNK